MSIYSTRHGVKADERGPSCQSCHGNSDQHVSNSADVSPRPLPDTVFGSTAHAKKASSAQARDKACLGCHESGARIHWQGSVHDNEDVACTDCHKVHFTRDPVHLVAIGDRKITRLNSSH